MENLNALMILFYNYKIIFYYNQKFKFLRI